MADTDEMAVEEVPKIQVLAPEVVNRIAAGEVIQRPANAIKEMMENCLDAKATQIRVIISEGGLKKIQIVDNGCGIRKEDLAIVCERFTTSKLTTFEDLKSISTYGFRGEALASISHVAHVSIVSYPSNQECAYKALYKDGKIVGEREGEAAEPKPSPGVRGTTITVEDLFYQIPARRKAIKNVNEEYLKIVDVVTKYAIHNSGVAFSVKKTGDTRTDVSTQRSNSPVENIRILFTSKVASELVPFKLSIDKYSVNVKGHFTNANFSSKKTIFILFINDRLVENKQLKRGLENAYTGLFTHAMHPWIYMSIHIPPQDIDVNVSPTKHEVKFLHQAEIVTEIVTNVAAELQKLNSSRTFDTTQALNASVSTTNTSMNTTTYSSVASTAKTPPRPDAIVRTDTRERTIQSFLKRATTQDEDEMDVELAAVTSHKAASATTSTTTSGEANRHKRPRDDTEVVLDDDFEQTGPPQAKRRQAVLDMAPAPKGPAGPKASAPVAQELRQRKKAPVRQRKQLTSVTNLLEAAKKVTHPGLRAMLDEYVMVGVVNSTLALIQFKTKLFLCNVKQLSREFFYQEVLQRFGEFDLLKLDEPAPLEELILMDLDAPDNEPMADKTSEEKHDVAVHLTKLLKSKSELLRQYFSIDINNNGELLALPQIIEEYRPNLELKLPRFIVRLAQEVEWRYEQECFDSIAREMSLLYAFEPKEGPSDEVEDEIRDAVEHVLFPAFKDRFWPPRLLGEDGTVLQLTSTEKLYKVFERC